MKIISILKFKVTSFLICYFTMLFIKAQSVINVEILKETIPFYGGVSSIEIADNGQKFITGGHDGRIAYWEVKKTKPLFSYNAQNKLINSLYFINNEGIFFSNQRDSVYSKILQLSNKKIEYSSYNRNILIGKTCLAKSDELIVAQHFKGIKIIYVNKKPIHHSELEMSNFKDLSYIDAVAYSPIKDLFALGGDQAIIWDRKTAKTIIKFPNNLTLVSQIDFIDNGNKVVCYGHSINGAEIFIYDTKTAKLLKTIETTREYELSFDKNQIFYLTNAEKNIESYSFVDSKIKKVISFNDKINCFAVSPKKDYFIISFENGNLKRFSNNGNDFKEQYQFHAFSCTNFDYSADSSCFFAYNRFQSKIKYYNAKFEFIKEQSTPKEDLIYYNFNAFYNKKSDDREIFPKPKDVYALAFSNDEKYVYWFTDDKLLKKWDILNRKEVFSKKSPFIGDILILHPNQKYLCGFSFSNQLILYNLENEEIKEIKFNGKTKDMGRIIFSKDGKYLLYETAYDSIKILDTSKL